MALGLNNNFISVPTWNKFPLIIKDKIDVLFVRKVIA
jgi:hypothetical protein